jgi:hypothetical protein
VIPEKFQFYHWIAAPANAVAATKEMLKNKIQEKSNGIFNLFQQ